MTDKLGQERPLMAVELYTLSDISKILGIKTERLSRWLVRGFIKPSEESKGQGKPSRFTRKDIYLIRLLEDMIDHGIDGAEAAKCTACCPNPQYKLCSS
jgi:DNA-binding transcriptional MerR regulator